MQTALGAVLRDDGARQQPCGVFGSFGWSGEAVDEMESRLKVKQTPPSRYSSIWCLLHTTLQSVRHEVSAGTEMCCNPWCVFKDLSEQSTVYVCLHTKNAYFRLCK